MNYAALHSVILIHHPRVRLDFLRPVRVLGPGVFHFEGDIRYRIRTISQRKLFDRGAAEIHVMAGDSLSVLKQLSEAAAAAAPGVPLAPRLAVLAPIIALVAKQALRSPLTPVGDIEIAKLTKAAQDSGAATAAANLQIEADRFHAAPALAGEVTAAPIATGTPELHVDQDPTATVIPPAPAAAALAALRAQDDARTAATADAAARTAQAAALQVAALQVTAAQPETAVVVTPSSLSPAGEDLAAAKPVAPTGKKKQNRY